MLKSNIFSNIFSHCNFVSHVQIIEFIKENARSSRGGPSGLSEALMIKFDKKARKEQSRSVLQGKIFPFILKRYIYNSKDLKELKLYIDNLVLNIFFGLIKKTTGFFYFENCGLLINLNFVLEGFGVMV